jgi:S1-C subfamily serine protease
LIEAGVVKGDLITSINGGTGSWNNLTQALKLAFPGDIINLEILNSDNPKKLLLTIKTQPIN